MSQYYCHRCSVLNSLIKPIDPNANYTGSLYQVRKFTKHSVPSTSSLSTVSYWDSSDYNMYKDYIINTAASGSVELDDLGRTNIVWAAGKNVGYTLDNGVWRGPNDGVKLVLQTIDDKLHAYSTSSVGFSIKYCASCGRCIIA